MSLAPGVRLGPYEIHSAIGAGGMGEVYRARDTKLGRDIAIKVLPERLASDRERLLRFEQEARLASSLNHPNIVTIHDIGKVDQVHYIAMELVEGQTLRSLLRSGPIPIQQTIDVAAQIADGLAKAHEAGIVHRDLKPENVMVTKDGFAKILDFGLGKLSASFPEDQSNIETVELAANARTGPGTILGTVNYMSPEQAAGGHVDFRSDQFAFGLVLYEMVTGRVAFRRPTAVQTMSAIIVEEPKRVAELNPRVPERVEEVIERCLAKKPDARYASTMDLARDLRSLRDHFTASRPLVVTSRSRGRRAWLVGAAAVLALAAAWRLSGPVREWFGADGLPIPGQKQIAVLAFKQIGGEASDQYVSDGLTETLTSKLTQLEQFEGSLRVVPSSEVRSRNISSVDEARRAFGVNLAINGSFQRTGENVRINVNLIDARSLRQLRAVSIQTRIGDASAMQDGVVARVADLLEVELQPRARQTLAAGGTSVPEAYLSYLQGRGYLQRFDKPGNVDAAADLFRQALSKDAGYALARAGLGEAYWRKYELTKDRQWIEVARESCANAVQLNNDLAPVHVTLGVIDSGTGQYEQAVQEFQVALRLDPASADAFRGLASAYVALNRIPEAEDTYRQAIKVRSNDWAGYNSLGVFYYNRGLYAKAEEQFRAVIQLTPDNFRAYRNLGGLYVVMSRPDEAVAMLEKSMKIEPSFEAASNLGTLYFEQGRYAESATALESAVKLKDVDYRVWRNLAAAYRWAPGRQAKMRPTYEHAAQLAESDLTVNPRNADVLMDLADCYAMLDQPARAHSYLERALGLSPDAARVLFKAGNVYEQLGEREHALAAIGRAIRQGYPVDGVLRTPELARLRADPRFKELQKTSKTR